MLASLRRLSRFGGEGSHPNQRSAADLARLGPPHDAVGVRRASFRACVGEFSFTPKPTFCAALTGGLTSITRDARATGNFLRFVVTSDYGPSRRFTVTKQFGRIQGHNGHYRTIRGFASVENDPQRHLATINYPRAELVAVGALCLRLSTDADTMRPSVIIRPSSAEPDFIENAGAIGRQPGRSGPRQ